MDNDIPARLGDLLEPTARRAGIEDAARTGTVWNKWRTIVGPEIAQHAEPSSLREGTLRVRADSPVWATELGYLGDEIRRRANEAVGGPLVQEVRVWTGPGRVGSHPEARSMPASGGVAETNDKVEPAVAFRRAFMAWRNRRLRAPRDPSAPP